jgi:N-acetylneuraminic acid mutarotase
VSSKFFSNFQVTWKWTRVEMKGDIPEPREGHDMVLSNDKKKVYMFGGFAQQIGFSDELFEYDVASHECKLISVNDLNAPSPRYYHTSAIIKDKLYIMGGWKADGGRSNLEHLYCFNLRSKTWLPRVTLRETPFLETGISESCSIAIGEDIFTFGGRSELVESSLLDSAFILNTNNMMVHNIHMDNCTGRAGHCMIALGNARIMIIGGHVATAHDDVAIIINNLYDQGN